MTTSKTTTNSQKSASAASSGRPTYSRVLGRFGTLLIVLLLIGLGFLIGLMLFVAASLLFQKVPDLVVGGLN